MDIAVFQSHHGWDVADDAWNVTNDKVWGGIDDEVPF
jgi:hypothetical protein